MIALVGCGGSASDVQVASSTNGTAPAAAAVASTPVVPATDVVSQFLDLVRRGGTDSGASTLLTSKAQSELQRIGRTVQPIGSPDARFTVTRSEMVPSDPNAALVHSVWAEPGPEGTTIESQVVWAVQKEANQWRISGLAMEFEGEPQPMIVNFEDGNRMAALLADVEGPSESSAELSQAASNPEQIDR
ncbi:hypothetical protein Pla22_13670 [Rubripirellula amarantea]|uniref:DUF3828 domain-containing protein n=2 Tax=Rubripirellula amarantea TaxID=2527999 RepID=A0A5C5WUT7_9BACT|nr:hypothetical protein Pla22_13670 [Rubripirellula amarantea]